MFLNFSIKALLLISSHEHSICFSSRVMRFHKLQLNHNYLQLTLATIKSPFTSSPDTHHPHMNALEHQVLQPTHLHSAHLVTNRQTHWMSSNPYLTWSPNSTFLAILYIIKSLFYSFGDNILSYFYYHLYKYQCSLNIIFCPLFFSVYRALLKYLIHTWNFNFYHILVISKLKSRPLAWTP